WRAPSVPANPARQARQPPRSVYSSALPSQPGRRSRGRQSSSAAAAFLPAGRLPRV
ncbi:hypothetical protein P7K49_006337, partial [Saguinus oedipus]